MVCNQGLTPDETRSFWKFDLLSWAMIWSARAWGSWSPLRGSR